MTAKKPKSQHKQVGRPTVRTPEVMRKIEEVAMLDGTVEEMAYYAGIHRDTLYAWMATDKDLSDRISSLRQRPVLLARQSVANHIKADGDLALKYLERKRKSEFSPRTEQVEMNITEAQKFDEAESAEITRALNLVGLGSLIQVNGKTKKV